MQALKIRLGPSVLYLTNYYASTIQSPNLCLLGCIRLEIVENRINNREIRISVVIRIPVTYGIISRQ